MSNAKPIARQRTTVRRPAVKEPLPLIARAAMSLPAMHVENVPKQKLVDVASLPDRYAMQLCGSCMAPYLRNGTQAAFSKSEPARAGDFVIIWFKPEILVPGDYPGMFKILGRDIPPFVSFPWSDHPAADVSPALVAECTNPPRKYAVPCSMVLAVHKCIGVVK